jgi:integrase
MHTVQAKPEWGFTTKSHEHRTIPLPAELVAMLKEWKKESGDSSLLFPNRDNKPHRHFIRELKTLALRAGLNCGRCVTKPKHGTPKESCKDKPVCDDFFLHRFRKTFATRLHHAGVPLRDLQKILGHKSLETTELYLAESDMKTARMQALADKAFSF